MGQALALFSNLGWTMLAGPQVENLFDTCVGVILQIVVDNVLVRNELWNQAQCIINQCQPSIYR